MGADGSTEPVVAFGVVADGSTETVVAFCVVAFWVVAFWVVAFWVVAFWVVGAAVVPSVVSSPRAADDTIQEMEISPTRTKTKVILLQTILLLENVVVFFRFEFLTIRLLTIVNLMTLFVRERLLNDEQ